MILEVLNFHPWLFHLNFLSLAVIEKPVFRVCIAFKWALTQETCLRGLANNMGVDQPAHPHRLISAFVICFWKVLYLDLLQAKFQFSS